MGTLVKYKSIESGSILIPIPNADQMKDYTCGASCLLAICKYYGIGPDEEDKYTLDMKIDEQEGSHPYQIIEAALKYGLSYQEVCPMSIEQLKDYIKDKKPAMIAVQAWAEDDTNCDSNKLYSSAWEYGHWIVAIGFDNNGIFFEDPVLQAVRGYLPYTDLLNRWHDLGPKGVRLLQYGLVLWKANWNGISPYYSRAAYIL